MAIDDFSEKKIRNSILNKVTYDRVNKNSPHWKLYIYIENKLVTKVKIPNSHNRIMKQNKSQYIAKALKLDDNQFNDLINCPLSGTQYKEILQTFL